MGACFPASFSHEAEFEERQVVCARSRRDGRTRDAGGVRRDAVAVRWSRASTCSLLRKHFFDLLSRLIVIRIAYTETGRMFEYRHRTFRILTPLRITHWLQTLRQCPVTEWEIWKLTNDILELGQRGGIAPRDVDRPILSSNFVEGAIKGSCDRTVPHASLILDSLSPPAPRRCVSLSHRIAVPLLVRAAVATLCHATFAARSGLYEGRLLPNKLGSRFRASATRILTPLDKPFMSARAFRNSSRTCFYLPASLLQLLQRLISILLGLFFPVFCLLFNPAVALGVPPSAFADRPTRSPTHQRSRGRQECRPDSAETLAIALRRSTPEPLERLQRQARRQIPINPMSNSHITGTSPMAKSPRLHGPIDSILRHDSPTRDRSAIFCIAGLVRVVGRRSDGVERKALVGEAGSVGSGVGERSGTGFGLKRDAEGAVRTHRSDRGYRRAKTRGGNQGVAGSRRWCTACSGHRA